MIFGGRPGGVFGSSGSGVTGGGRKTISRFLFDRPLPLSFSSSGRQQSVQMSNSRPSISFWKHSFWLPQRSQRITFTPPLPIRVYAGSLILSRPSAGEIMAMEAPIRFDAFSFGSIRIDGITYEHDVVIDQGQVRKRKKKPSKKFRGEFGHTPLSAEEEIPWTCRRLVIGTGTGALPVMDEVKREAARRKIKLLILPTLKAIEELKQHPRDTNAILHVTC